MPERMKPAEFIGTLTLADAQRRLTEIFDLTDFGHWEHESDCESSEPEVDFDSTCPACWALTIQEITLTEGRPMTTPTPTPRCCFIYPDTDIQCPLPAVWDTYPTDGSNPTLNTQGCLDHIGHLLDSGKAHSLYEIGSITLADPEHVHEVVPEVETGRCILCGQLADEPSPPALVPPAFRGMVVCPDCGNKRCPKATDRKLACTGSNEPGQSGSIYEGRP